MEEFIQLHKNQLDGLQIPYPLYHGLKYQLDNVYTTTIQNHNKKQDIIDEKKDGSSSPSSSSSSSSSSLSQTQTQQHSGNNRYDDMNNNEIILDIGKLSFQMIRLLRDHRTEIVHGPIHNNDVDVDDDAVVVDDEMGAVIVIPHICSWDMSINDAPQRELFHELQKLPIVVLRMVHNGLNQLLLSSPLDSSRSGCCINSPQENNSNNNVDNNMIMVLSEENYHSDSHHHLRRRSRDFLINAIADHPCLWSRIILYRASKVVGGTATPSVRAALPAPPYYPQKDEYSNNNIDNNEEEADLTGPFPFQYTYKYNNNMKKGLSTTTIIDLSLVYASPGVLLLGRKNNKNQWNESLLPTIDLVPAYQCPDQLTRAVRYVMLLLGNTNNNNSNSNSYPNNNIVGRSKRIVQEYYADFVRRMHLVRQQKLEQKQEEENEQSNRTSASNAASETTLLASQTSLSTTTSDVIDERIQRLFRVYTDSNDPMGLCHPTFGLMANSQYFEMVDHPHDADIIFSYQSLFTPGTVLNQIIESRKQNGTDNDDHVDSENNNNDENNKNKNSFFMINQFPYEGAFVQKDHLAREVLKQHGLPRPFWSIEAYDLDVQLTEFAGAALVAIHNHNYYYYNSNDECTNTISNNNKHDDDTNSAVVATGPIWIVKPSRGTRSMGHVVTRSLAQILRLVDAGGMSRTVQRYIEHPVCVDGRKVDCRCVVLMTDAKCGRPTLLMHKTVYFRIANKRHIIQRARDLSDPESVLTATHLLDANTRTSDDELRILPQGLKTISKLESDYKGSFDWQLKILPQIKALISELFNGMTKAFPLMEQSHMSRAVYGVDVMFEIENDGSITPKLTEVTFCPANNAVCEAYERDHELSKSYNKEIFEALFLGIVSNNLTKIQ